jgi:hypothetical protein
LESFYILLAETCEECCEIRRINEFNSLFTYDKAPIFVRRVNELNLTIEHDADPNFITPVANILSSQPNDDCIVDVLDAFDQVCVDSD